VSTENRDNGWNEYSRLVLKELETLAEGIQALNAELQEVRKDILRLEGYSRRSLFSEPDERPQRSSC